MGELAEVGHPVTETAGVVGSFAEPAVVQHDQVDAHFGRLRVNEKEESECVPSTSAEFADVAPCKTPTLNSYLHGHVDDVVMIHMEVLGLPGVQQHWRLGV